jgi:SAM-dependent methyltransferase
MTFTTEFFARWHRRLRLTDMPIVRVHSLAEYETNLRAMESTYRDRWRLELTLCEGGTPFSTVGQCYPCNKQVQFETDFQYSSHMVKGIKIPNWRERVLCPCLLNNRTRASVHILEQVLGARAAHTLYVAEQVTPLYATLEKRFPRLTGSEYLGNRIPFGETDTRGVRNESITHLTFGDHSFDYVLNFDVLEHIPNPEAGLGEIHRVLKPNGHLLLSVPFLQNQLANQLRARINSSGEVEYLLPPQYHGDPISDAGCLCFQDFGWELLDQMRAIGFRDVAMLLYWSPKYGYYGIEQMIITAKR